MQFSWFCLGQRRSNCLSITVHYLAVLGSCYLREKELLLWSRKLQGKKSWPAVSRVCEQELQTGRQDSAVCGRRGRGRPLSAQTHRSEVCLRFLAVHFYGWWGFADVIVSGGAQTGIGDLYIAPRLSLRDVFASRRRVPEDPPPSLSSISIIRARWFDKPAFSLVSAFVSRTLSNTMSD